MLDVATRNLDRLPVPPARGVHPVASAVGQALLHALEQTLGPEWWSRAARAAWADALAAIVGALRPPGARPVAAAA